NQRQRFALVELETDALDRLHPTGAAAKTYLQVFDFQQRCAHAPSCKVLRGSKASRAASPMKMSRLSITASTTNEVMPSQGACRLFFPCSSSSPSDGEPGG